MGLGLGSQIIATSITPGSSERQCCRKCLGIGIYPKVNQHVSALTTEPLAHRVSSSRYPCCGEINSIKITAHLLVAISGAMSTVARWFEQVEPGSLTRHVPTHNDRL